MISWYSLMRGRCTAAASAKGADAEVVKSQALPSRHTLLYKTEYNGCAELRWTAGVLPRSANASCTLVLRQVSNLASK